MSTRRCACLGPRAHIKEPIVRSTTRLTAVTAVVTIAGASFFATATSASAQPLQTAVAQSSSSSTPATHSVVARSLSQLTWDNKANGHAEIVPDALHISTVAGVDNDLSKSKVAGYFSTDFPLAQ